MIDFSHANSSKQYKRQMDVSTDVAQQVAGGEKAIMGVMVESHLEEGNQNLEGDAPLVYGKSVTDACIGWEDTETLLRQLADAVKPAAADFAGSINPKIKTLTLSGFFHQRKRITSLYPVSNSSGFGSNRILVAR